MWRTIYFIHFIIFFHSCITNAQSQICNGEPFVLENDTTVLFNISSSGSCWCNSYEGTGAQLLVTQNSNLLDTITTLNNTIQAQNNAISNLNKTIQTLLLNNKPSGQLLSFQTLTSSNSYTKNVAANSILVECIGGGGGGGGAIHGSITVACGGGGGAGGYCRKWITNAASTYTYAIGKGGNGGAGVSNGTSGGSTTFGSLLTAVGGSGGSGYDGNVNNNVLGGMGGSATGGDINFTGQPGVSHLVDGVGGAGGSSVYGGGASEVASDSNGNNAASNSGSGGSGAATQSTTSYTGGNGGSGLIIVWEYS